MKLLKQRLVTLLSLFTPLILLFKHSSTHKFKVTQFIFDEHWVEDQSPKDCRTFLQLVGQVQKLHHSRSDKHDKLPIVIHAK
jgi:hypothetical protein